MTTSKPSLKRTRTIGKKSFSIGRKKARIGSTVLGNIAGYVPRNRTTLSLYPGPFQAKKLVTFEYQNSLSPVGPGTGSVQYPVSYNDLFDFDKTAGAVYGNKQPLYYDTLLSASGPYKAYKVKSWVCTFTVINNSTTGNLSVFALPPMETTADIDSTAEADNMPGVVRGYATIAGGSKTMVTLTTKGTPFDVYPLYGDDSNTNGPYNNSPGSPCYGGLFLAADSGNVSCSIAVHCEMLAELSVVDALVS